jgi:hypothetical protein
LLNRWRRPPLDILGDAEIQEHRLAFVGQQYVSRLEVTMQDFAVVRVGQSVGKARRDPQDRLNEAQSFEHFQDGRVFHSPHLNERRLSGANCH